MYQQFPDNAGAAGAFGHPAAGSGTAGRCDPAPRNCRPEYTTTANRAALATSYFNTNHADKALPLAEQLLAAEPNNFDILMLPTARIVRDQRKYPEAARDFASRLPSSGGRKAGASWPPRS